MRHQQEESHAALYPHTMPLRPILALLALLSLTSLACQASLWESAASTPTPEPAPISVEAPAAQSVLDAPAGMPFVEVVAADANTFNPLQAPNATARDVVDKILPHLALIDPANAEIVPADLANGWVWSVDGRALTITLRSDITWSDGQSVTSADAAFTLQALLDQGGAPGYDLSMVESMTTPDVATLALRLRQPDCTLLPNLTLPILPSHLFTSTATMADHAWMREPTVGAGPFLFAARAPGEGIVLRRNPTYAKGAPAIDPYRMAVAPEPAQRFGAVQSGAADLATDLGVDAAWLSSPTVQTTRHLQDGYSLLAINLADPANPQPGREQTGAIVAQNPHPILGDARVRRALAAGLDVESIVRDAYGEAAAPLVTWVLPSIPWAHETQLTPYGFNRDGAALLLEEAGWSLPAGETVRRKGNTPLQLTLVTNEETPVRVRMAEAMRASLAGLGFDVRVETLPFADASAAVLGQRYDLAIVGWEGLGSDPGLVDFFSTNADVPGAGANVTSYQSPEMDRLLQEARAVPGCAYPARGEHYRAAQRLVYEGVPVILLSGLLTTDAWDPAWQGITPSPWPVRHDVEGWVVGDGD